jgi:pectate lyase
VTLTAVSSSPPPAAPTGVIAVGGNAQVTVSWDIMPGALTYSLWRSTTPGGPYTLIAGNLSGANLGYVDSSVTNATTYHYVITANGNGTSGNSPEVSATPSAVGTPSGFVAAALNTQAALYWSPLAGATGYNVKRSTTSGGPYSVISSNQPGTYYLDTGLANGTPYYYVVSALSGLGEGPNTAQANVIPSATLLNRASYGSASASWQKATETAAMAFDGLTSTKWFNDNTAATGWLQYNFGSGVKWAVARYDLTSANDVPQRDPMTWQLLGSNDSNTWTTLDTRSNETFATRFLTKSYTVTNPCPYQYYRLNILANAGGAPNGLQLAELALLAYNATPALATPPTGLSATAADAQVSLIWAASADATSYNVKRATTDGGPYATIAGSLSGLVHTNTGLTNGTVYYYVVTANNDGGESLNSAQVSALPLSALQAWQLSYFGCWSCPQAAGDADFDGDGMSNTNEFLAGTDPTNSASAFRILSIVPVSNSIVITWQSVAGKTNVVQANSADITGPIVMTGTQTNYTEPSGLTNASPRLYRVRLP